MTTLRNIRKKVKLTFKKEIIGEGTNITVNHLIRSLPFSTKTRLCTIRKQALYDTLSSAQVHVRKTYSLSKLLEIAKETFRYEEKLNEINKKLSIIQNIYKKYYNNIELRLQGPGIPVNRCVNEDCPYTMETLTDISKSNIFTWKDDKIYGCDFQPLYQLISKHMDRSGTLYECKEDEYRSYIDEYTSLSRLTNKRRFNRSRLGPITNPFTRSPFPGEAFNRVLDIGKRKGLFSKEPHNQRIRQRRVQRRRSHLRHDEINITEDATEVPSHTPTTSNVIDLSTEVSEYIRSLDFYTPDTVLTDIIRPIFNYSHSMSATPLPVDHTHSMRMLSYITQSCIPILEYLADHLTSSVIRNNINRRHIHYDFYRNFRQRSHIRVLHSHHNSIQELIQTLDGSPRQVSARVRRYSRMFLNIWSQTLLFLNSLFTSDSINVDDKKSIAIFIIISLAQTGFLREGFEWAIGL